MSCRSWVVSAPVTKPRRLISRGRSGSRALVIACASWRSSRRAVRSRSSAWYRAAPHGKRSRMWRVVSPHVLPEKRFYLLGAAGRLAVQSRGDERLAKERHALWPSEAAVSDVVGRLIEFWGSKRNMGRIWAVLYLSPEPLSAEDL